LILFFWHMSATWWLFHGFYHMKKKKPRCEKGQQPRYKKRFTDWEGSISSPLRDIILPQDDLNQCVVLYLYSNCWI
jgi:hypothetical protein